MTRRNSTNSWASCRWATDASISRERESSKPVLRLARSARWSLATSRSCVQSMAMRLGAVSSRWSIQLSPSLPCWLRRIATRKYQCRGMFANETYLLIGGGYASSRTAECLRQEGFGGRIIILSEEPHLPYSRPPLCKRALTLPTDIDRKSVEWGKRVSVR